MSAISERQIFRLVNDAVRRRALAAVEAAPELYVVEIKPPTRNLEQSAKFHAMCADIAKAKPTWNGIRMDADDWKALLVLSHAIATGGADGQLRLVPDLDGKGFVQLRESTARMSKQRAASLISYVEAWGVSHGVQFREPAKEPAR